MCTTTPPEEWRAIGVAQWKGELYVLEQCEHCRAYRAALLDVDDIPIVEHTASSAPTGGVTKTDPSERSHTSAPDTEAGSGAGGETAVEDSGSDGDSDTNENGDGDGDGGGDWLIE